MFRKAQPMGKERAIVTPERIEKWFSDFEEYLKEECQHA